MQSRSRFFQRFGLFCGLSLIAIPAVVFYLILWKNAVDIPIFDDYSNVLSFANQFVQIHGFLNRLWLVLTFQHNEYKLIFENAVVATQYLVVGKIHFLPLVALGNSFALLIFLVVCAMFWRSRNDPRERIWLLIPVSCLVFQLQYASALEWASSSLQHLAVIFFSLLSIHLLTRHSLSSFAGSSVALIFAIASSANGFFVVPVGLLILLQTGRWRRIPAWICVAAVMLGLYLWNYNFHSSQTAPHGSVADSALHLNVIYVLSFLGSSVARYQSIVPSAIFGVVLIAVFLFSAKRRYFRENPSVFYSMLFIIITAIGVSGLRSGFGVSQSLASRYRTYSNLFLVFSYIFAVDSVRKEAEKKVSESMVLWPAIVFSALFCAVSSYAGARYLHTKKLLLVSSVHQWQTAAPDKVNTIDNADANPAMTRQIDEGFYLPQPAILNMSDRLGLYKLPAE